MKFLHILLEQMRVRTYMSHSEICMAHVIKARDIVSQSLHFILILLSLPCRKKSCCHTVAVDAHAFVYMWINYYLNTV